MVQELCLPSGISFPQCLGMLLEASKAIVVSLNKIYMIVQVHRISCHRLALIVEVLGLNKVIDLI